MCLILQPSEMSFYQLFLFLVPRLEVSSWHQQMEVLGPGPELGKWSLVTSAVYSHSDIETHNTHGTFLVFLCLSFHYLSKIFPCILNNVPDTESHTLLFSATVSFETWIFNLVNHQTRLSSVHLFDLNTLVHIDKL